MKSPRAYLAIMNSVPNRRRFVISRLLRVAGLSRFVTMTVQPGVRLRLYPTSLSESYWMVPHRDGGHHFFEAYVKKGMTVVDVGANIGGLALHAANLVGPTGRVVALEAHPATYQYLIGNIHLNRRTNVEAINIAAGASPGVVTFSDYRSDDVNRVVDDGGRPRQNGDAASDMTHDGSHAPGVSIPVDTLDRVLDGTPVGLLKIDVEGYEKFVLEGAWTTLRITECVFIESYEPQFVVYGYHTRDILALLHDAGFNVFRHDGHRWIRIGLDHTSDGLENLVALRDPDAEPPPVRPWSQ